MASTEEEHLALCLIMLARSQPTKPTSDPPSAQNLPYKCLVCGRGFARYQALGGHKASHKKIPDYSEDRGALADKNAGPDCDRKRGHQCTICLKMFASGQALGGHKRCHYEGGVGGGGAPAMSSSACKGFDLNLPAREEEEEEVVSYLAVKKQRLMVYA